MRVSFHGFTLDGETRQLSDGRQPLHLSPKAFSLLLLLVERRPAVVDKGEIARRIWPDVTVSDASLGGLVKEVRRVLGDDPSRPSLIRTVHTVGYAFIGRVDEPARAEPAAPGAHRCWLTWDDRTFSLGRGENVVGRDPRCSVWLDESGISRRHARILVEDDVVTIEDLGSRNGTSVGGEPVRTVRRLEDGDRISLGATTVTFRVWSEERAPLTEPIGPRAKR